MSSDYVRPPVPMLKQISGLDKKISKLLISIGMWVLFLLGCLVALDVVMRYVFNSPISGAWEIVELSLVLVVFSSVAYAYEVGMHVNIDILLQYLERQTVLIINNLQIILSLCLFIVMVKYSLDDFFHKIEINMESMIIGIPHSPFALLVPVGCLLLCIMLFRNLISNIQNCRKHEFSKGAWIINAIIVVVVLFLVITWLFVSPVIGLNPIFLAVISLPIVFVLIAMGMPVSFSLLMGGILFLPSTSNLVIALNMAGRELFSTTGTANWVVLGLFTMMGYFIYHSRLGEDLFKMANHWLSFMPGGLAMATVGGSTAIAACSGGSMTSSVVMGTVAYPQMKKYGYSETLSTGVICAGATLGPLIPPSIPLVFYGLLTKQSIGELFIAAFIPGILLALFFLITIYLWCKVNPSAGIRMPPCSWKVRLSSAYMVFPVLFLLVIVIGGIYSGIFTPTEAGGVAAFSSFGIAFVMGRLTWKTMNAALRDAALMTCAIMLMIAGGKVYSYFIIASGIGSGIAAMITNLQATPSLVAAVFLIIFLFMGCFIDIVAVILITIPILLPIAQAINMDLVWFGILMTIVCNLGLITPPFGANLFLLKMVNHRIPMTHIYRGVIPFVISTILLVIMLFIFPSIITWLPDLMS